MSATPRAFTWAGRLVRLASSIVPAPLRAEWQAEWNGELAAWTQEGKTGAVRHATGAFGDALWLRQRDLVDAGWLDDLRHGWRQLRDHHGFAFVAIGVLAIGMAASITAFSVVSQVLLRPLPYSEPDRIVTVWERQSGTPGRQDVAPGDFLDWKARTSSFAHLAGIEPYSHDFTDADRPEVWRAVKVTPGFFESFALAPALGRWFAQDEYTQGRHRVVMLSAGLWRTRFAADPTVVGRRVTLDGEPWEVVGVMPDVFEPNLFESRGSEVVAWTPKYIEEYEPRIRAGGYWQVVGRLAPGASLDAARAELDAVATQIEVEQPRSNRGRRIEVLSLREHLVGDVRSAVELFTAAVVVVLLIACVNVTNLLLARGAARTQEMVVRSALGAGRWRLVGQLLVESALLASLSAAAALGLAAAAMQAIARLGPADVPWIDTLHIDWRVVAFAAVLSLAVTVLAGLVPALRSTGLGGRGPTRTATGDAGHRRLRSGLVVAEVALALVLVTSAALLLRSFVNLVNVDTGFTRSRVAVLQMFAWDRNPGPDRLRGFFARTLANLAAVPGVDAVGAVMAMPFIEANIDVQNIFRVVGDPAPAEGEELRASFNVATPGYFQAVGIPIVRGRAFEERDDSTSRPVAIVSEALAARVFRDRDPIGQRLSFRSQGRPAEVEVVGVMASVRHDSLDAAPRLEVMRPFAQSPTGSMTLVLRTRADAQGLMESAKQAIWAVDPLQTFYRTATLDELVARTIATRRFALYVLVGFAALGLVLAAAGLYGVLTALATQQRREIGVRVALGATWLDVVRLVLSRGLVMVALGLVVGLAAALGVGRLLRTFLFGVGATDPWTLGGAVFVMVLVAVPASLAPARRAAATRPVDVLRAD